MDFTRNTVETEAPNFVGLGILAVNELDEFNTFCTPATIIRRPTDGPHWPAPDHVFGEATAIGMSAEKSEQKYSYKTDFGIWRENQDFGRQNISISLPPLESTPISTNMTSRKTSPIDLIPIRTKTAEPTPQTLPTELATRPIKLSTQPMYYAKRKLKA